MSSTSRKTITNGDTTFYQFDEQMGFWGVPGMKREVYFSQQPDTPVLVEHNSEGNRDSEIVLASGEKTIVCMGGSHTWGGGVGQKSRYPDHLALQSGMRTVNLGHCSLGLDQVCLAVLQKISKYNPGIIVIEQYPWAVHRVLNNYVNGYVRPHFYLDAQGRLKFSKLSSLARVTVFRRMIGSYYAFRKEFNEFRAGMNIRHNYDPFADPIFLHWKTRQYDYMYQLIDGILVVIRDYCRQKNIKLLFALGAIYQQFAGNKNSELVDYELPRDRLIALLEKHRIVYMDMTSPMLSSHTQEDPVIFSDGHINEKGHRVFADEVFKELQKLNWLPK
jgi:lysophospholipase L1-like esterase